ncbi:MAG: HAD family hydrolase [Ilumatobacteraceae bacterium]|nr:HAD family hydrolase [Ilumatobacteraceae bacterium]MBP8210120.1 HAD family hydrolase [Ilumatobacteraceae bacterium]HRC48117.1 HAD family hydrolase [Ilumatobacteraceae bacterium]
MNDVLGVLFDFGGTLFAHDPLAATIMSTSRRLGTEVTSQWAEALADRVQSAAHTADELRHPRDLDDRVWRQRWHVLYALADDEIPGLGAELYGAMHDPLQWQPYAATVATLQRVHATGVPIAVVSNTGWDVRTVFAARDLQHLVHTFVLSYEVGAVKPSPQIFHDACRALHVQPQHALMVGDDPVADAGAVRAGLRTLLLPALPPGAANGVEAAARIVTGE